MASAFSENEKKIIKLKLNDASKACLGKFGVKKTSVAQIAEIAGISKGAFYLFYPSKEILFFSVFEEYQSNIIEETTNKLSRIQNINRQELSGLIYELFQKVRQSFIMNIIQNQEFEYLIRKLPEEVINNHHSFDDKLAKSMFSHLKLKKNIEFVTIAASLRAIFMSMLHVNEIGEKEFDQALKLIIAGLVQQLIEEDS